MGPRHYQPPHPRTPGFTCCPRQWHIGRCGSGAGDLALGPVRVIGAVGRCSPPAAPRGTAAGRGRARPLPVSSTHSLSAHSTEMTLRTRGSGRKSSCWAHTRASYGSGGTVALVWLCDSPGHTLPLACPTLRLSQGLHTGPALSHTPTRVRALPGICH